MSSILKLHFTEDGSFRSRWIMYLIYHPGLSQLLYQGATLMQLSCIIGFFTRRFDRWLLLILLLFHLGNLFLLSISFWENGLTLAPFVPWTSHIFRFIPRHTMTNGSDVTKKPSANS